MEKRFDILPLEEWGMFTLPRPFVIAGPCSAESEEQLMDTARQLRAQGINVLRAGIWKPRTHPGCFEGAGPEGLKWLKKAKNELSQESKDFVEAAEDAAAKEDAATAKQDASQEKKA